MPMARIKKRHLRNSNSKLTTGGKHSFRHSTAHKANRLHGTIALGHQWKASHKTCALALASYGQLRTTRPAPTWEVHCFKDLCCHMRKHRSIVAINIASRLQPWRKNHHDTPIVPETRTTDSGTPLRCTNSP